MCVRPAQDACAAHSAGRRGHLSAASVPSWVRSKSRDHQRRRVVHAQRGALRGGSPRQPSGLSATSASWLAGRQVSAHDPRKESREEPLLGDAEGSGSAKGLSFDDPPPPPSTDAAASPVQKHRPTILIELGLAVSACCSLYVREPARRISAASPRPLGPSN